MKKNSKLRWGTEMEFLRQHGEEVFKNIPNPFGTFKKARYELYFSGGDPDPAYAFVTTCRDEESCIEILKEKFKTMRTTGVHYFTIKKIKDGKMEVIFSTNRTRWGMDYQKREESYRV